ncbi:MAG: aromatic amino acid hydroxylase [Calditrichaeota bacterium]|nr:MAG: aromatic amino acid hydroxylase [Calditrichota bacterium]
MGQAYQDLLQSIPVHLRHFVVDQNYSRYTAQDHALWRYIMRRNMAFLKDVAHPAYVNGLIKTGISTEYIPNVFEMNEALGKIGWKAVIVDGFLPPAVFMEFQLHRILVISADMRTIEHALYTPAPDIVHEAAGHAPIIADPEYASFLQRFGYYGTKAFSSQKDIEIYEAIRLLSIIKEYPATPPEEIERAEADLKQKIAENTRPSEMTLLSRMHWWTVEYGLIGTPDDYKIYGAGLLSSVGESKNCLRDSVKKLPLTLDCINYNYDITKEQPQLFVNRDWAHLNAVLEEYAETLAFRRGGVYGMEQAKSCGGVSTVQLSSGVQISGMLHGYAAEGYTINFLRMQGPVSLAVDGQQLEGHGTDYHRDGYSTPVGRWKNVAKDPSGLSNGDLQKMGIVKDSRATLEFESGIMVNGIVRRVLFHEDKLLLITWSDCTVKGPEGQILFQPDWGMFDMAVGASIPSVFSGTADKERHNVFPPKSEKVAIPLEYDTAAQKLHAMYKQIREIRQSEKPDPAALQNIRVLLDERYPDEWLLRLELLELSNDDGEKIHLQKALSRISQQGSDKKELIEAGLALL